LKAFVFGLVVGVIAVPLAVCAYFMTGAAPAAASAPAMPFEKMLAHGALHAHVEREMPKTAPIPADEAAYLAGARIYREHCALCHGAPGEEPSALAKGMFPKPPALFKGEGVTDDEPGETYWKVANGIRLTGMPSFQQSLSETQMWQVSLLLANADKVPDSVKQILVAEPAPSRPAAPPAAKK
jgi:thiosulfate dehydrogenase